MKSFFQVLLGIAAAIPLLTSCGGGSGGAGAGGGNSSRGPFDASAFAGSTVSFNPTLTFFTAGVLEYSNEATSPFYGTDFPETLPGNPAAGTYTYTPSGNFQTGTLTISVPSLSGYTASISVTDFVSVNGIVTGFKLNFPIEGTYEAVIESGTILAAPDPSSGSTSPFVFGPDGNLVPGTTITKAYQGGASTALNDNSFFPPFYPRSFGDVVTFTVAGNGNLEFLGYNQSTGLPYIISLPFLQASNGIVSWRKFDVDANGTILVNLETRLNGFLSAIWEEDLVSGGAYDFERQVFR